MRKGTVHLSVIVTVRKYHIIPVIMYEK